MIKKIILSIVVALLTITMSQAQGNDLLINSEIKLPKDSTITSRLILDINNFLNQAYNDSEKNNWVPQSEKLKSSILLSELFQISKYRNDGKKIKSYLNGVTPMRGGKYLIQISYIELTKNDSKLFALFEMIANRNGNSYEFSSTLSWNTRNWETKTDNYFTCYYDSNTKEVCDKYVMNSIRFDKMFENSTKPQVIYFSSNCNTLSQLLRLSGILYHKDYNGLTWSMTEYYSSEGCVKLFTSLKNVDPYDIFRSCALKNIPSEERNWVMACGAAYFYAGEWGYNWTDIQKKFKTNFDYDAKTDWLTLYFNKRNFGDEKGKNLYVTYLINGLIVQDLEEKKGFSVVKELIASGNMHKNKEQFFKILEKLTGINESNFNKKIGKLIDEAMRKL